MRPVISAAALFVKVTARMRAGSTVQVRDAMRDRRGQCLGLAGAGAGDDQGGASLDRGSALLRGQIVEDAGMSGELRL